MGKPRSGGNLGSRIRWVGLVVRELVFFWLLGCYGQLFLVSTGWSDKRVNKQTVDQFGMGQ